MLRALVLALVLSALGCGSPEPDAQGRNTPLNEEVDEVSKVRDQVLD